MRKGEKRKLDVYCTVCHKLRILRSCGEAFTVTQQQEISSSYVCTDHPSERSAVLTDRNPT
jgi:hypothetical protein